MQLSQGYGLVLESCVVNSDGEGNTNLVRSGVSLTDWLACVVDFTG